MPNQANIDAYVKRALQLVRVGNHLTAEVTDELRKLAGQVRRTLGGSDLALLNRRELSALLGDIDALVTSAYERIAAHQAESTTRLITIEAKWAAKTTGADMVSAASLERARLGLSVMGNTLDEHWNAQAVQLSNRIAAQVRLGINAGQTDAEILRRAVGSQRRQVGGVLDASMRQAKQIVDASTQAAADAGRRETMKGQGVNALRWHAILDAHVCPSCGEREGKMWTVDGKALGHAVGYASPPLHPGCRCILIPLKYPDAPPADGGPQKDRFSNWLNKQPQEVQDDVLGKGRAELWRKDVITTSDLIGQNGLALSLSDLQKSVDAGGP